MEFQTRSKLSKGKSRKTNARMRAIHTNLNLNEE